MAFEKGGGGRVLLSKGAGISFLSRSSPSGLKKKQHENKRFSVTEGPGPPPSLLLLSHETDAVVNEISSVASLPWLSQKSEARSNYLNELRWQIMNDSTVHWENPTVLSSGGSGGAVFRAPNKRRANKETLVCLKSCVKKTSSLKWFQISFAPKKPSLRVVPCSVCVCVCLWDSCNYVETVCSSLQPDISARVPSTFPLGLSHKQIEENLSFYMFKSLGVPSGLSGEFNCSLM